MFEKAFKFIRIYKLQQNVMIYCRTIIKIMYLLLIIIKIIYQNKLLA